MFTIGTIWYKFYFFLLVSLVKVKLEINLAVKQKWSFVLNSFGRIVGDMVEITRRKYFYNSYNSHQMRCSLRSKREDKFNQLKSFLLFSLLCPPWAQSCRALYCLCRPGWALLYITEVIRSHSQTYDTLILTFPPVTPHHTTPHHTISHHA